MECGKDGGQLELFLQPSNPGSCSVPQQPHFSVHPQQKQMLLHTDARDKKIHSTFVQHSWKQRLSKLTELHTSNVCTLLYIHHTPIKLNPPPSFFCFFF